MSAAVAFLSDPEAGAEGVRGAAGASASAAITQLLLPSPPSANKLFGNPRRPGQRRVPTQAYSDWKGHAGWRLKAQAAQPIHGPVLVLIGVERTSDLADIDNRIKPTLDLLVAHKIIDDDRFVIGVAAAWSPAANAEMRVAIIPAANLGVRFQLAPDGRHGGWFLEAPQPDGEA